MFPKGYVIGAVAGDHFDAFAAYLDEQAKDNGRDGTPLFQPRRRGLGKALVQHAIDWARRETAVEWIDLTFIGGNHAAERLYRSLGFEHLGTVVDMYRIDGESVESVSMTWRLRR